MRRESYYIIRRRNGQTHWTIHSKHLDNIMQAAKLAQDLTTSDAAHTYEFVDSQEIRAIGKRDGVYDANGYRKF